MTWGRYSHRLRWGVGFFSPSKESLSPPPLEMRAMAEFPGSALGCAIHASGSNWLTSPASTSASNRKGRRMKGLLRRI